MSIQTYIINDVKIRPISEKIQNIQDLFSQFTYSHIPVEKEDIYIGCISENDARCFDPGKTLEDYQYSMEGFYAREEDNWLDALDTFAQNQANILPVLDENNVYLGYVELHDIINIFTESPFLNGPGGILIVEKGFKDYSFSEISQIAESNGAHILGAFVSKLENDVAQITVKIGQTGLNTILQAFRRYGYNVISSHQEDTFKSNLRDRSRYLDKYLNV
ncbi:CBS domain-containing protein [Salinimicrobium sp. GXAS 041]|uniref:CBS domain-containing protein n=1 Tax=Salinimicrobium sp. GXAS 041 TaxID=3400806 RepID=UPI003C78D577